MTFDPYVAFCGSAENLARRGFDIRRFARPIVIPRSLLARADKVIE